MTIERLKPHLSELLFPVEDRSALVQAELRGQLQLAMQIVGALTIIMPLTAALSLSLADLADYPVLDATSRGVASASHLSGIILGVTLFVLAKRITTPAQGRVVLFAFAVLSTALLIRQGLLISRDATTPAAVVTYMLVIAVSPFRPKESWALGLVITLVFIAVTLGYPAEHLQAQARIVRVIEGVVPLIVLSAGGGVMSGVLYQYRSRVARAHAERTQLQDKMKTLAEVTEVSPVPTMRFHLSGELLWASPAAQHYAAKVGAPNRTIEDYLPAGFRAGIPEATSGSRTQMVNTYEAHGRFFNVNYKPIPGEEQFIVTLSDVTNETRARRKAERFAQELEQAQVKLVQTEKMASLGNLVAGVAHEVNTPLGAMKSNNQVLIRSMQMLDELGPDKAEKRAKVLKTMSTLCDVNRQAIQRIDGIVDSLRRFARLDQSERGDVDLCAEIENTLTLVRHELKGKVRVHRNFQPVPPLNCYPNQLNQVFMNLIVNAIQSIENDGDVYIDIEGDEDTITVRVRDTGCGINPDHLVKVFDPGFTTKGVGVGTGLGLSIVHRIVEEHRGTISVESVVGEGSTMTVELPLDATVL